MAHKNNHQPQKFSMSAPAARSVLLAGDFTHWQDQAIPLKKQPGGVWQMTVKLAPGEYHYRFIVDGQWRDDPDCTLHVPNPYGGADAVRQVAERYPTKRAT